MGNMQLPTDESGNIVAPDMGNMQLPTDENSNAADESGDDSSNPRGIVAEGNIVINGGNFNLNTAEDAIHANSSFTVNGGVFDIYAGDDGMNSSTELTINDGTINIYNSYEGIESKVVNVNGGNIHVTASDDGFNAADSESSANSDMGVQDGVYLYFNGGYVYVNAEGDGIDSNGYIIQNGGTVIVDGPSSDGNGSIDSGGSCSVKGGSLIAAGSSGMAETPSNDGLNFISYTANVSKGEPVTITDTDGNVVISYVSAKSYSNIVICSELLAKGSSYQLYVGGSISGSSTDGLYTSEAALTNGTLIAEFTIDEAGSYFNESGATTSNSMGGMNNFFKK